MSDRNSFGKTSLQRLQGGPPVQNLHSPQWGRDKEYYAAYPNRWAFIRSRYLRDFACEFLGE